MYEKVAPKVKFFYDLHNKFVQVLLHKNIVKYFNYTITNYFLIFFLANGFAGVLTGLFFCETESFGTGLVSTGAI